MPDLTILADMAGRHTPHDVYDLWTRTRDASVLFGWQTAAGEQVVFCLDTRGELHPVAVPWTGEEAAARWSDVTSDGRELRAEHALGAGGDEANFGVRCWLDDELTEFVEAGASLLFPTVCFDTDGGAWVAMIATEDVENADGVVDQRNYVVVAREGEDGWVSEQVADLAYGLLPRAGVWGYPGERRRPYIVPDDRGGVWLLWERKEPHDGSTTVCAGALLGRRFVEGSWLDPVRIIEQSYMGYAPDRAGVIDGRLLVAAQKGEPYTQPGRGEVVLLSAAVDDCSVQPADEGFDAWTRVDLPAREYFEPAEREMVLDGEEYRLIFGDPHSHTGLSEDAEGDLVEMLAYARDKAQVDFVATTDNDYIYGGRLSDAGWRRTMAETERWSEDGRFIAIPAYEWTQAKWGPCAPQHRSILFASYDQPMLRWSDAGIGQSHDPFDALVSWIGSTNGIMNTQHANFLLSRSEREANMEVICGWGDYINKSACFHEHLDRGFREGFVGTSDGHRRTPGLGGGLTGLWVKEFTLSGIIEALGARRCFATAGNRMGLQFWVDGVFMGGELPSSPRLAPYGEAGPPSGLSRSLSGPSVTGRLSGSDGRVARVVVDAPREVALVEVFGDGEVVASTAAPGRRFELEFAALPACSWYYVKVAMVGDFPRYPSNIAPADGPWAWSSPVFVSAP